MPKRSPDAASHTAAVMPSAAQVHGGSKHARDDDVILMKEEHILNTYQADHSWNAVEYISAIRVDLIKADDYDLEFDLVNVDAPIANALRRILLAEVPTMAIDKVCLDQNTSLIQDEVLAHRLGLIPFKADPRLFDNRTEGDDEERLDAKTTLQFKLHVKCTKKADAPKDAVIPEELYDNVEVLSKHFKWLPIGNQAELFKADPPRPVHDDILIAKMRLGQEIEATCFCYKGIGRDHAKFSPVATASYRLLPEITLLEEIEGEEAEVLKACFSPGVIDLKSSSDGRVVAKVANARQDTCSRNIFQYPKLANKVVLSRQKRHFIFSVESTGALKSASLVEMALDILSAKCRTLLEALDVKESTSAQLK